MKSSGQNQGRPACVAAPITTVGHGANAPAAALASAQPPRTTWWNSRRATSLAATADVMLTVTEIQTKGEPTDDRGRLVAP